MIPWEYCFKHCNQSEKLGLLTHVCNYTCVLILVMFDNGVSMSNITLSNNNNNVNKTVNRTRYYHIT